MRTNRAGRRRRVLVGFQDYYQQVAKPFTWEFTAADLKKRLDALKEFNAALP